MTNGRVLHSHNLVAISLLVVLALGGARLLQNYLDPAPGVTRDNFRRLHVGMTTERAVSILGEPQRHTLGGLGGRVDLLYWWSADDLLIIVLFDDNTLTDGSLLPRSGRIDFRRLTVSDCPGFRERVRRLFFGGV